MEDEDVKPEELVKAEEAAPAGAMIELDEPDAEFANVEEEPNPEVEAARAFEEAPRLAEAAALAEEEAGVGEVAANDTIEAGLFAEVELTVLPAFAPAAEMAPLEEAVVTALAEEAVDATLDPPRATVA